MLRREKLKAFLVLLVISILAVNFSIILSEVALGDSLPRANYKSYLPIVFFSELSPEPTPTPPPPKPTPTTPHTFVTVYVDNRVGRAFWLEIINTGIGRKYIFSGRNLYGSFPTGTYKFRYTFDLFNYYTGTQTFRQGEMTWIWIP